MMDHCADSFNIERMITQSDELRFIRPLHLGNNFFLTFKTFSNKFIRVFILYEVTKFYRLLNLSHSIFIVCNIFCSFLTIFFTVLDILKKFFCQIKNYGRRFGDISKILSGLSIWTMMVWKKDWYEKKKALTKGDSL